MSDGCGNPRQGQDLDKAGVAIKFIKFKISLDHMSFQNTISEDGYQCHHMQKHQHQRHPLLRTHRERGRERQEHPGKPLLMQLSQVDQWRQTKGALHVRPKDFDPSRYASFSVREVVEEPVNSEHIHEYVERSRLSRRLGF